MTRVIERKRRCSIHGEQEFFLASGMTHGHIRQVLFCPHCFRNVQANMSKNILGINIPVG